MADDLFEEEKDNNETNKKTPEDAVMPSGEEDMDDIKATSDDESWIPLDEDDLDMTPAEDDQMESPLDDEEISYEDIGEAYAEMDEEEMAQEDFPEPENDESSLREDVQTEPLDDTENTAEHSTTENIPDTSHEKETIFEKIKDDDAEGPPWDEIVEIPAHDAGNAFKSQKTLMIIALIVFVAFLFTSLYVFLQYKKLAGKQVAEPTEETALIDHKRKEKIIIQDTQTDADPKKEPITEQTPAPMNITPIITGMPETNISVGQSYSFMPMAKDADAGDKLTFFIANQPAWTRFDLSTGSLSGIPKPEDVGNYKNIVILASDGQATTSLPEFNIKVHAAVSEQPETVEAIKSTATVAVPKIKKEASQQPTREIAPDQPNKKAAAFVLPDMIDLIRQSKFQEAAFEYYEHVKNHPEAYSLKLEVDCLEDSVRNAFQKGKYDPKMFILSRDIKGRTCYIVLWGLYPSNHEAIEALSSVPAFFETQSTKPELILIKKYL